MSRHPTRTFRVAFNSFQRCWEVTYFKATSAQLELFDIRDHGNMGWQIFHTEERANKSGALWVSKGRNLPTERWNDKQKCWK